VAYTLAQIAARFGGCVLGDAGRAYGEIATLERADSNQISFLSNSKYRSQLASTKAGAVILGEADKDATDLPRIVTTNPYAYFARVSALMNPYPAATAGVHPSAVVHEGARIDPAASIAATAVIGKGAAIGKGAVIGEGCIVGDDAVIGDETRMYPRVVVYHGCLIGDRVVVHSGAVIGADGFGFAMDEGKWIKVPQIGRVVIGNDVEIGANTTIDRGALDDTVIEEGVKLDNQIQIAHNVRIGAHTAIAGCVGIAGSTVIGKRCQIGGSAGILGHLRIADDVVIASFTLIGKSIHEAGSYAGVFPFSKTEDWRKNAVHMRHLDEMAKRIKMLEQGNL
jgi:UDP-3-O-[3-hydroxymyristoyl] glucosamine N-acyltransferase